MLQKSRQFVQNFSPKHHVILLKRSKFLRSQMTGLALINFQCFVRRYITSKEFCSLQRPSASTERSARAIPAPPAHAHRHARYVCDVAPTQLMASAMDGKRTPTTGRLLTRVINSVHPDLRDVGGRSRGEADAHEVFPGLLIGDMNAAKDKAFLRSSGVTHVVNAAENLEGSKIFPSTGEDYYRDTRLVYKGLALQDLATTDIARHFQEVADFIQEALDQGGKVLVHCLVGVSRSATLVLAYLMIKQGMTAKQALRVVRGRRYVCPNQGFLDQLAELDNRLARERFYPTEED